MPLPERLLSGLFMLVLSLPAQAEIEGINRIRSSGGISEYRLESNGLTILLAPIEGAEATTFSVTYQVGSRNESYGTSGATHLLEHLMFKGTAAHNKQAGNGIDQLLEGIGAETNATTGLDSTNYITTLSPEHLPLIIELDADRMRNLRLREEDLRPEMSVVWDEYDRGEDDPATAMDREIWATAFQAHPYRHSVIGWRSDIENVPMSKLREFYDTYYWPDQATITVSGAVGDPDRVLAEIKHRFGPIPRAPKPVPKVYTVEPPQTGIRRFTMKRPGEANLVAIAHKSPPARHPDHASLLVLCDLLADGQNCRFYDQLTDAGLTLDVTASAESTLDPSLLIISAEIAEDTPNEDVEDGILEILDDIIQKGVEEDEVKTSIARLSAQAAFARDGSAALAETLSLSIEAGDWSLYQSREKAIRQVTAATVQAAAKRWLTEDSRTIGWYVSDPKATPSEPVPAVAKATPKAEESTKLILPELPPANVNAARIAPRVSRTRTAGLDLLVCPGGSPDIVHLSGSLPLGTPANQPLASLVTEMIQLGTSAHDGSELGRLMDEAGITLEFMADNGHLHFTGSCLSSELPKLLSILAEQLRQPSFPEDEFSAIRDKLISEARSSRNDPQWLATLALNRAIFPAGHAERLPDATETIAQLQKITRKNLLDFYQQWFGPTGAVLVLAGDLRPGNCQAEVERCFGGWSGEKPAPEPTAAPESVPAAKIALPISGKESITVLLGQPCRVRQPQQDALALSLATAALGDGFTSRLVNTVRDTEGLTYGISAGLFLDDQQTGLWSTTGTFAPEFIDRGLASIHREIERWHRDGLDEREFAYRRNALLGSHRVQLATTAGIAEALHTCVLQGLPPEWLDESQTRLMALTRDEVNAAIHRHLDPQRMIEVTSGALRSP